MHANLHMSTISRGSGRDAVGAAAYRSAVACAAYRASEKLKDERYHKTHDYSKKENVLHSEIMAPNHAPDWMKDRQQLWNGVEAGEKRKNAQLAKEVILTLPRNLSQEQHIEVTRGWINENIIQRNHLNRVSAMNDNNEIVFDLRSYREKGIDKEPQRKIGPKVKYLEQRGYRTEWGKELRQKQHEVGQRKASGSSESDKQKLMNNMAMGLNEARADIARKYYEAAYGSEAARENWQIEADEKDLWYE